MSCKLWTTKGLGMRHHHWLRQQQRCESWFSCQCRRTWCRHRTLTRQRPCSQPGKPGCCRRGLQKWGRRRHRAWRRCQQRKCETGYQHHRSWSKQTRRSRSAHNRWSKGGCCSSVQQTQGHRQDHRSGEQ